MYYDLLKLKNVMDMSKYSLKDLALFFEHYDGYVCIITTVKRKIKFKIEVSSLPHLIGLQHAFKGIKAKNEYKGLSGFLKMKNGDITYDGIMKVIKNKNTNITWTNIKNRIKFLPMFLNTISSKTTKLKLRDDELLSRKTFINGNYFLYKNSFNSNIPMFSLKNIENGRVILETFIVENDISLLGALEEEKIIDIKLISPLEIVSPIIENEDIKVIN